MTAENGGLHTLHETPSSDRVTTCLERVLAVDLAPESGFATDIRRELERARAKHPPINSAHEGYAVILEELDEFWETCRLQIPAPERAYRELVQIAAMAERTAEDVFPEASRER